MWKEVMLVKTIPDSLRPQGLLAFHRHVMLMWHQASHINIMPSYVGCLNSNGLAMKAREGVFLMLGRPVGISLTSLKDEYFLCKIYYERLARK